MEILRTLNYGIGSFFENGDPRMKDWPLMQNPLPGTVIIAAYVYFVKVAGPQYMKTRSPYDLNLLMVVYNFAMVLMNLWLVLEISWYGWLTEYKLLCQPVDFSNRYEAVRMAELGWWLYIVKFLELIDTVFFVLRKKSGQISKLHVIHHSIVPFGYWFGLKYAPGGYNSFFPYLNCFVHIIMYTYYGLAAMGPKYRKYLFWKKYMTYIQMAQFVIAFVFCMAQIIGRCEFSKVFVVIHMTYSLLFFALFYNFFVGSYTPRGKISPTSPILSTQSNGKLCHVQHVNRLEQTNHLHNLTTSEKMD